VPDVRNRGERGTSQDRKGRKKERRKRSSLFISGARNTGQRTSSWEGGGRRGGPAKKKKKVSDRKDGERPQGGEEGEKSKSKLVNEKAERGKETRLRGKGER